MCEIICDPYYASRLISNALFEKRSITINNHYITMPSVAVVKACVERNCITWLHSLFYFQEQLWPIALVAYGSGKRMVTGTRAGSRIKKKMKWRFLPHHKSQRRDIWCTNSPVVSYFNPKFVDRSVPYETKQWHVKFRRCFGNIPLAECNVSVPNVRSSGTEPKLR